MARGRLYNYLPTYLTFITYIRTWRLLSGWSAVKPLVSYLTLVGYLQVTLGTLLPIIVSRHLYRPRRSQKERKKERKKAMPLQ